MLDMKIEDYRITSDSRNIVLSKVRRDGVRELTRRTANDTEVSSVVER
ncbi:hypothetical protein ENLA111132_10145 [Enterococcus lactis]